MLQRGKEVLQLAIHRLAFSSCSRAATVAGYMQCTHAGMQVDRIAGYCLAIATPAEAAGSPLPHLEEELDDLLKGIHGTTDHLW